MALGKIDHIDFIVDNLEEVEEYFTKILGFKLLRHTMHGGPSIELESPAGDFFFDFHQGTEEDYKRAREGLGVAGQPGGDEIPAGPCQFKPIFGHIAFKADDINKEYEELKSKGVPVHPDEPGFLPTTGRTLVDILDTIKRFWLQVHF